VAHRVGRVIALLFHDHGTRRGEWSASRPGRFLPPGKTRYPLYRRLGRPQGRSGQVRKISPPPGFDPRTVQPVAQSLYRLSYPTQGMKDIIQQNTKLVASDQTVVTPYCLYWYTNALSAIRSKHKPTLLSVPVPPPTPNFN
jgi:hypothetical protein